MTLIFQPKKVCKLICNCCIERFLKSVWYGLRTISHLLLGSYGLWLMQRVLPCLKFDSTDASQNQWNRSFRKHNSICCCYSVHKCLWGHFKWHRPCLNLLWFLIMDAVALICNMALINKNTAVLWLCESLTLSPWQKAAHLLITLCMSSNIKQFLHVKWVSDY